MKQVALLFVVGVAVIQAQTLWTPGGTVGNNTSNGNVGIGSSTPDALLEIGTPTSNQILNVGTVGNRANMNAEIRQSMAVLGDTATSQSSMGATSWNFYNNGVSPSWAGTLLYFFGQSYPGNVYGTTAANQGALVFQNSSSGVIATNGMAPIHIAPHSSTGISTTFTANGNVGIGTTSPGATLDTQGSGAGRKLVLNDTDTTSTGYQQMLGLQNSGTDMLSVVTGPTTTIAAPSGALSFSVQNQDNALYINSTGKVGIGTLSPSHKLAVNGTIRAKEIIVDTGWADYVFAENYELAPLSEVEAHIEENGHLPDVPSAAEVATNGVSLGEMQSLLLAKIEELTLHTIRQEKSLNRVSADNQLLRNEVQQLKEQIR